MSVTRTRMERAPDPRAGGGQAAPVLIWAAIGAVFVALTTYLVIKWVTGPNFERVPVGPDSPPGWMRTVLMTGQIGFAALALFNVYWFLLRPLRRREQIAFDGMLCVGAFSLSVWDPASNYVQPWFSYNSYLLNWGAPIMELPGVLAFHEPGAQSAWSFPFLTGLYVGVFPWFSMAVCWMLRGAQRRFPTLRGLRLIAATYCGALLFDILLEGVVFMPLGFWTYGGGWWPVMNGGTYYQLPLNGLLHAGLFFSAPPLVRHFTNDRGETLPERGISHIRGGRGKQQVLRILAVTGMVHVTTIGLYHLPSAFWGANSREWPADVKNRSYFLNSCGPVVDRACPAPDVPLSRPGSGYLDWEGNFVVAPKPTE